MSRGFRSGGFEPGLAPPRNPPLDLSRLNCGVPRDQKNRRNRDGIKADSGLTHLNGSDSHVDLRAGFACPSGILPRAWEYSPRWPAPASVEKRGGGGLSSRSAAGSMSMEMGSALAGSARREDRRDPCATHCHPEGLPLRAGRRPRTREVVALDPSGPGFGTRPRPGARDRAGVVR